MTTLFIKLVSQQAADVARSTIVGVLTYTAPDLFVVCQNQFVYDYGASNNSAATPFPVFIGDTDARAYQDSIATTDLLSQANTAMSGSGVSYGTVDIELIDAPVLTNLATLATVAHSGSYLDLINTPVIPTTFDNLTDGTTNKGYTATEKTKLAGIASGATANSSDAVLLSRTNHTGTQLSSTISDFATAVVANAPVSSVAGRTGAVTLTSGDVGLGNVNNTSDANKPVSTAQATAIATKFTTPTGSTSQYVRGDGTLGTSPSIPVVQAYEGTTQRLNAFPIFKDATVASGVAVFNLTVDGTSTGAALFPNGVIADSLNLFVSDSSASYQMAGAWSNGNKTLTVTANKLGTANILTGILGQIAANGAIVKLQVWVY